MGKANGENAQVSYVPKFDAWAIASKNVCLLARTAQDAEQLYPASKMRFNYAKVIAKQWFEQLRAVGEQKTQELKRELTGKTAVGEYCGQADHQHLVLYDRIDIHFYALVAHDSNDTCLPPAVAAALFDRFGLKRVSCTEIAAFTDVASFKKCLLDIYDKRYR